MEYSLPVAPSPSIMATSVLERRFGDNAGNRPRRGRRHSRLGPSSPAEVTELRAAWYMPPLLLLASLSARNQSMALSAGNNLRNNQQQQGEQQQKGHTKVKESRQLPSCMDKWHISIEDPAACTNSRNFPIEWSHSSLSDSIFHDNIKSCCEEVVPLAGKCAAVDACGLDDPRAYGWTEPAAACDRTTWHMSTEVLNACTNDDVYPARWKDPVEAPKYLFRSSSECCDRAYPLQRCEVIDAACPTPPPAPPPTPHPTQRTRKPRPTQRPTPGPTTTHTPKQTFSPPTEEPTPQPSTTPPDWFVDRTTSQCYMDCENEPGRPCKRQNGAWEQTFADATSCCESIPWILNCLETATHLLEGEVVTEVNFDWYMDRGTNKCVQSCVDVPGHPCGGLAGKWETVYSSVDDCCAAQPWTPAEECAATASPVTPSPTTSYPPTRSPSPMNFAALEASSEPTRRPRTSRPSASPTLKPTPDCEAPNWYLLRNGVEFTCTNDSTYRDEIFNSPMKSYLLFGSADDCCRGELAGSNCVVEDVCATVRWFGDYSRGWDDGNCISTDQGPVPKGRRTFDSEMQCCLGAFLGQSSDACLFSIGN